MRRNNVNPLHFIVLCCCIYAIFAKSTTKPKDLSDFIQGDCKKAKDSDMVFHEVVEKTDIPFMSRNATTEWYGDYKIFCIKVLNEYNRQFGKGGGKAFVKKGGLDHNYVTIEMHSQKGYGLSFLVMIYGKKMK
ncbi:uncharacterized protein LOC143204755 [Rhynchophorus ferrugineus]|uniref:Uncharacterized protein n=1 Tax=Rhynchophorus ferrugineus TaxID=354439 RepID=A0A834IFG4_RHYFE|nr:hypothetical protein GWI33_006233 [Rhynchophorus ferrugineus]